jgi:ubiquinone/menaquinone biosynthesis C-methylase UbiE
MTSADPVTYYDAFSHHYDRRRAHGYHALIDELEASFVGAVAGGICLEAGCGTGLILQRLRSQFRRCVGIDLSHGMLQLARNRDHSVARATVTALPFRDQTFDRVCSFKVLAHVPDIHRAMGELVRVTKPGGLLALEFYNRRSLRGIRWRLKLVFGGEATGAARETDLYTRYDDLRSISSFLPADVRLEAVRGSIVVTPFAGLLRLPVVGRLLTMVERLAARSWMASYGGFVTVILRRL